jgi:hypothetical protein
MYEDAPVPRPVPRIDADPALDEQLYDLRHWTGQ